MRISRNAFSSLPVWLLPWLSSPIVWDDACLLTCAEASDISHAVRASDGRVYDIEALHEFFASCGPAARVLPHEIIDFVVTIPWVFFMTGKLWKRVFWRACQINMQSKKLNEDAHSPCKTSELPLQSSAHVAVPLQKSVFMRVIENNIHRVKADSAFLGKRGIKRSASSAFQETTHSSSWKKNKRSKTSTDVNQS